MNAAGCLKALGLAGRIILENGGETYRAEDTVLRMAQALGLAEAIAGSLAVVSFGIPMLQSHDTSAYREEARRTVNAETAA